MKLKNEKWHYDRIWWPYRHDLLSLRYWFSRWAWDTSHWPSLGSVVKSAWDNALAFLTPWYSWRRSLIMAFSEYNNGKLLSRDRKFASVRTRGAPCTYYHLACGPFRAKLEGQTTVRKSTGEAINVYAEAVSALVGGREIDDGDYETKVEALLEGACLTRSQCQRLLDRIVEATPDLRWFNPGEGEP